MTVRPLQGKYLWGFALLVWMAVIFSFSSLPGSGGDFEPPLWYILERKGAHVFEFCLLSFLAASFFSSWMRGTKEGRALSLLTFLFCLVYAFSDEIHQFFVFGREARFTDVLIDTGGVILGLGLYFLAKQKKWTWKSIGIHFKKTKTSQS